MVDMTEEEVLEAYADVIKKARMIRYLLQSKHSIVQEPLQKPWARVTRADYNVLKPQKIPPPPFPLPHAAQTTPTSVTLCSRHGSGVFFMFAASATSSPVCSSCGSGTVYASSVFLPPN